MYKIFTDKGKLFKCNIDISGASMKDCYARLLLETDENIFLYKGKVNSSGICEVEIPKIKNFEEGVEGKMKLEVIVENTLFEPWESDFVVTASKKVNVKVDEEESIKESKIDNSMKVSVVMEEDEDDSEELIREEKKVIEKIVEEPTKEPIKVKEQPKNSNSLKENKDIFTFDTFIDKNKK